MQRGLVYELLQHLVLVTGLTAGRYHLAQIVVDLVVAAPPVARYNAVHRGVVVHPVGQLVPRTRIQLCFEVLIHAIDGELVNVAANNVW